MKSKAPKVLHTTVLIVQVSLLDYVNDLLRHAKALTHETSEQSHKSSNSPQQLTSRGEEETRHDKHEKLLTKLTTCLCRVLNFDVVNSIRFSSQKFNQLLFQPTMRLKYIFSTEFRLVSSFPGLSENR